MKKLDTFKELNTHSVNRPAACFRYIAGHTHHLACAFVKRVPDFFGTDNIISIATKIHNIGYSLESCARSFEERNALKLTKETKKALKNLCH